jgi:hypothetical protein
LLKLPDVSDASSATDSTGLLMLKTFEPNTANSKTKSNIGRIFVTRQKYNPKNQKNTNSELIKI